jgi:hypothetical protein
MAKKSKRVTFQLSDEEMQLAKKMAKREKRYGASSVNLWCRDVVRQYLHEFRVMPEAWGNDGHGLADQDETH